MKRTNIKMENIFENLNVSESCFKEILEMISKEVQVQAAEKSLPARKEKVQQLIRVIGSARNPEERNKAIKDLGNAQKRVSKAESRINKDNPKNPGIVFTPKAFS